VYDTSLVRQLCAEIIAEKDTERTEELISLLQAVVKENTEEIRIRMAVLAKKYSEAISDSKAAD
jgi:hypothetical protein